MSNVMACIDGSPSSTSVCDYAAWASQQLSAPLTLLHVLDKQHDPIYGDLSGSIGLGSREHLLDELAALDEKRSKLALDQGKHMLEAAKQRVMQAGISQPLTRQRHGALFETLHELEEDVRLLVMGRSGDAHAEDVVHVGSQLENVIRIMHRPILVVPKQFEQPRSAMLAFDGSPTIKKGLEMLAKSPLCRGMPIHLVMVGANTADAQAEMQWAKQRLHAAGFETHTAILAGDVEPVLHGYQTEHGIDLLIMGAYGHSRIRQFLVGSTTNHMIRTSTTPILLLR